MIPPLTAQPRAGMFIPLAEDRLATPEQRLWRTVLYVALSDAYNGGGTRVPMDQRGMVQAQAREWWADGNWRGIASVAGLSEPYVIGLLKRAGLAHLLTDDRRDRRLMKRLNGRLNRTLREIQRQATQEAER